MNTLQNCISLSNEIDLTTRQNQRVRRGRVHSCPGCSHSDRRQPEASIFLLYNALSVRTEQIRGRSVDERDIRTTAYPGFFSRFDCGEISTRRADQLNPRRLYRMPVVKFSPRFWYVGIGDGILIALNRLKISQHKLKLFCFFSSIDDFLLYICPV